MSPLEVIVYGIAFGTAAFLTESVLDYAVSLPSKRSRSRGAKKAPTPIRFDVDAFVADLQGRLARFEVKRPLSSQGCDEGGDGAADGSNPLSEFAGVGLSGLSREELIEKLTVLLIEFMHLANNIGESVEDVELNAVASFDLVKAERESLNAVGEAIKGLSDDLRAERLRRGHVSSLVEDVTERVAQ